MSGADADDGAEAGSKAAALLQQGLLTARGGDLPAAARLFHAAARTRPDLVLAWHNLFLAANRLGDRTAADAALRRRLILQPGSGLGWRLRAEGTGLPDHRRAAAAPDAPNLSLRIAAADRHQAGRLADAWRLYRRAVLQAPEDVETIANMAAVLNDGADSLAPVAVLRRWIDRALTLDRSYHRARYLKGWIGLRSRDWSALEEYRQRWLDPLETLAPGYERVPLWQGGPVARLGLWGQFGVGDEVLFSTLLHALPALPQVNLQADGRLVGLFRRSFPGIAVHAKAEPLPDGLDAQASTAALPAILGLDETFRVRTPALIADPERVAHWRARFADLGPRPWIGSTWRGGVPRTGDAKSLTPQALSPILAALGGTAISLQYGENAEERAAAAASGARLPLENPAEDIRDDLETLAAQIAALDGVVSISGLTAHLAGALARPGLIILPGQPLWFWFDRGRSTPFYPSLYLTRKRGAALPDDLGDGIAWLRAELARGPGQA